MDEPDLDRPSLYLNRELSQCAFIRRVLSQAEDPGVPLLERLRFLCITSAVLDEFFEIRVAGLVQREAHRSVHTGPDGLRPTEVLQRISDQVHEIVAAQYRILNEELIPALEREGILFLRRNAWSARTASWVAGFFHRELLPLLSPLGLDPSHPFPRVQNKSLNFIVSLAGEDAFGRGSRIAVLQAPRALPRIIHLPVEAGAGDSAFVFLSSIIHAHVAELFPGMEVRGCHQFRLTRNSDLFVDEEEVDDLRNALEGELRSRAFGEGVRLEIADTCSKEMTAYLLTQFGLGERDLYQVAGPVNLHRLSTVPDQLERPDLKFPGFQPATPKALKGGGDLFEVMRKRDILLHHPFESFAPVVDFIRKAARDPEVLAIKQTLYRTSEDSALTEALEEAALAGKEVTAVVELRARFDERRNIDLAERLQDAGAYVAYGVVGFKTHAKMTLVLRREEDGIRRYAHLGTGNYHQRTARLYTDFGLLTTHPEICEDVHRLFLQLTGLGSPRHLKRILQSPFTLHRSLLAWIDREILEAEAGRPARIIAKMNALTEPRIIKALYRASRAGVEVDLIPRGVCCLRPGIPGVSERIRVRSIIGRFLEHTRVFWFRNGGDERLYLASADWMDRNFFRRVETCFPVLDPTLARRIREECLENYLRDDSQSWILRSDGSYERSRPAEPDAPRSAQARLLEKYCG